MFISISPKIQLHVLNADYRNVFYLILVLIQNRKYLKITINFMFVNTIIKVLIKNTITFLINSVWL